MKVKFLSEVPALGVDVDDELEVSPHEGEFWVRVGVCVRADDGDVVVEEVEEVEEEEEEKSDDAVDDDEDADELVEEDEDEFDELVENENAADLGVAVE